MERRSVDESYRMGRLGIDDGTATSAWGIAERDRRMRPPPFSAPPKLPDFPPNIPKRAEPAGDGIKIAGAVVGLLYALGNPSEGGLLLMPAIGYAVGWLFTRG